MTRKTDGFTLVELAIVMIIIGLLIGGVLKGQQLIENAKVTATVAQLKSYQSALHSFKDTYANLPGDMASAMTRLSGCTDGNSCSDGDGNGIVGDAYGPIQRPDHSAVTTENTQFWKHLALADLITGVSQTALTPAWGETHPASRIRGGFMISYATNASDNGHFLILQNPVTGWSAPWTAAGENPLSPLQAAQIDRKLDDGLPETGSVLGYPALATCKSNNLYSEQLHQKNCVIAFMIDG